MGNSMGPAYQKGEQPCIFKGCRFVPQKHFRKHSPPQDGNLSATDLKIGDVSPGVWLGGLIDS